MTSRLNIICFSFHLLKGDRCLLLRHAAVRCHQTCWLLCIGYFFSNTMQCTTMAKQNSSDTRLYTVYFIFYLSFLLRRVECGEFSAAFVACHCHRTADCWAPLGLHSHSHSYFLSLSLSFVPGTMWNQFACYQKNLVQAEAAVSYRQLRTAHSTTVLSISNANTGIFWRDK